MKILVCGANGFIGAYVVGYLLGQNYEVVCCSRHPQETQSQFSQCEWIKADFNVDTSIEDWLPRLEGIDIVINCVGVLKANRKQNIKAIHYDAPLALYRACQEADIQKIIHLSALGVEGKGDNDYVVTKKSLDEKLLQLPINSVVLRPSLLYASGAFGGTSLFRAISILPLIPLVNDGQNCFQPLSMSCFLNVVGLSIKDDSTGVVNVIGPETLSMKEILLLLRAWLGYRNPRFIKISSALTGFVARLGDFCQNSPINMTSYKLLIQDNVADDKHACFVTQKTMSQAFNEAPSSVQDRAHAKLYFVKPVMFFILVAFWFFSGALPLLFSFQNAMVYLLEMGFSQSAANMMVYLSCFWDMLLALGLWFSSSKKPWVVLQLITIFIYTLTASVYFPKLWLDPLAPILKNIPILLLTACYLILIKER